MGTVSGRRKERRHRPCHLDFTGGRHHADILSFELPREALGRSLAVGASGVRHFRAVSPIFLLPAGLLPVRTVFSDEQFELCPLPTGAGVSSAGSSATVRRQSAGGHSSQVKKRHAQQRLLFLPPHQKRRPQKRALHLHRQFL